MAELSRHVEPRSLTHVGARSLGGGVAYAGAPTVEGHFAASSR